MEKEAHGYSFVMYWTNNPTWYRVNKKLDRYELTDEVPEKARRSFELYKKTNNLKY